MNNNEQLARDLYGSGWLDLPEFARVAAVDFVPELLAADAGELVSGDLLDRVHELADWAVPTYDIDLLALLADPATADAIFAAADELGGLDAAGLSRDTVKRFVSLGVYGVVSNTLGVLVAAVEGGDAWDAFGLDADAAEIAARLLPEWSGTVEALVGAARHLAAEGVTA